MLAIDENPPILSPTVQSLAQLTGQWWVGHTKARNEKAFAWDLAARGIGYFLPMIERVRFSGGRRRRAMMPLFMSYVFFCGDRDARHTALATNRLASAIDVADQRRLTGELTAIEKALTGRAELELYQFATVGRRCRITAGPFVGLEGTLVNRDKIARFVLEVSILGQGAALEIDPSLLEPVD